MGEKFIKHYHIITELLKDVFYYGRYTQKERAAKMNHKKTKENDDIRFLKNIFGDMIEESKNSQGKNICRLRNNYFEDAQRIFLRFFSLKSFVSAGRLLMTCFLLQQLNNKGALTEEQLKKTSETCEYAFDTNGKLIGSPRMITGALIKQGIIIGDGAKKSKYTIAENVLTWDNATREKLLLLTDLCTNIFPLSICGNGIRNKIDLQYRSFFLFKYRYLGQVFYDDMIWKLLIYITNRQTICLMYKGQDYAKSILLPYRIVTDKESGRQYLFAVCVNGKTCCDYLLRVDKISDVRIIDSPCSLPSDEVLAKRYDDFFRNSFSGITIPRRAPQTGTLVFRDSFKENVLARFPNAVPEKTDETHSCITVQVNDMSSLKPWLRRYLGEITLTESSDDTARELAQELVKWRKMYGLE